MPQSWVTQIPICSQLPLNSSSLEYDENSSLYDTEVDYTMGKDCNGIAKNGGSVGQTLNIIDDHQAKSATIKSWYGFKDCPIGPKEQDLPAMKTVRTVRHPLKYLGVVEEEPNDKPAACHDAVSGIKYWLPDIWSSALRIERFI